MKRKLADNLHRCYEALVAARSFHPQSSSSLSYGSRTFDKRQQGGTHDATSGHVQSSHARARRSSASDRVRSMVQLYPLLRRIESKHWAWPVRTTPFLPLPRSLWQAASDMPRRSQFFLKKLRIPSYSFRGIGSYVDCSLRDRFQNLRKE